MKKKIYYYIKNHERLLNIASFIFYFLSRNKKQIRGKKNKVEYKGAFLKRCKINICGENNKIIINKNARLTNTFIHIHGNNNTIYLANDIKLGRCDLWIEDNFGKIQIDEFTTINSGHLACTENYSNIYIGKDCMFADNITFRTGDSHAIKSIKSDERINHAKNIIIEDHVWIGANSLILKGSIIGNGSVVGSGSIVTKEFGSNLIIGGIPARIKKSDIYWTRERV